MAFMFNSNITKIPAKRDIQEMFNWYQDVKSTLFVWAGILEFVFYFLLSSLIMAMLIGIPWFLYAHFWGEVTVDTEFTAIITIVIFIVGILLGRTSKQETKLK